MTEEEIEKQAEEREMQRQADSKELILQKKEIEQ